ncbi:MAG TPA: hypothetical protein VL652_07895 [Kutzneria sp.]|jgi:hypothetical protein|nr:hypothetical protein [Kutzneria sp.]
MGWRTLGVVAAAALVAAAAVTPATAARMPHWQVTLLPLPADSPNTRGYLLGADGHSGYAGLLVTDQGYTVTTWNDGKVVVHGGPNGDNYPNVYGESRDDTVLVSSQGASFTLDRAGAFHPVSTGSFTNVFASVIGPCGDLAGTATDPADPSKTVMLYWPSPSAEPSVLAAALPGSRPQAIDDDGTVLFNHADGPYLLRDGVVRKLTLPAGYGYSDAWSIRHGVVAGDAAPLDRPGATGVLWRSPDSPQLPAKSATIVAATSYGTSVGTEYVPNSIHGPLVVWLGTIELGRLPAPDGLPNLGARFIAEDGSVAGAASDRPLDEGGRPAVWRQV